MNRIFRLFISSTFSDFMLERERLQRYVFPELEEYCASKGAKFLAVDLRWGITEAAQVEHDTLRICLDEIRRSQKLSPRPNFAVLLGNRYGWEPIPPRIPLDHWDRLLEYANSQDKKIIRSAYYSRPDTNAIPPNYILKSREGNWLDSEVFELSVRDALRRCAASFDKTERLPYFASATHQEIVMGAMETPNAKEHVHVYVRSIKDLPFTEEANAFIDWDVKTGSLVQGASERLKGLELELRARLPGMVRDYGTTWIGATSPNLISDGYLDAFCKQFFEDQKALIDQEMERLSNTEPYQLREKLHEDFAIVRSENFVGRKAILKVIYSYIASIPSKSNKKVTPLILHGEGGTGKSAIMAHAYQITKTQNPNALALVRFIGGVPRCEEIGVILRDLIEDICRHYQSPIPQEMSSVKELNHAFESVMNLSSKDRPLILFLDALDQLGNSDGAWLLEWLPKSLSPHTRFILTTREGATFNSAKRRIPKSLKPVNPMSNADGAKMLDAWLSSYKEARFSAGIAPTEGRKLSTTQRHSLIEQFKRCPKPLWLKLVCEEVRSWRSWDEPRIFPNEIKGMVSELINKRLLKDDKHLPIFTHRALAYIAAGRFGLAEDELAKVLGSDEAVRAEFKAAERTDKKWPVDRNQLPPILWSRLYFDLAPYLSSAQIDGAELFRYFHREFEEVVKDELLKDGAGHEIHSKLAFMFSMMGDSNIDALFRQTDVGGQQQSPALRRITEELWQLARGNQQEKLENLLTNFGYCIAKCAANQFDDLLLFYQNNKAVIGNSSIAAIWMDFVQQNSNILKRGEKDWPAHKIFMQLAIEHADNSPITQSGEIWLSNGHCNWKWLRKSIRPSSIPFNPCIAVLESNNHEIVGMVVISMTKLLTWSKGEWDISIWDFKLGVRTKVLFGHEDKVLGCLRLSDSKIISWSADSSIRIWNANDGSNVAILAEHEGPVLGVLFDSNELIISWSSDGTIKAWDLLTMCCIWSIISPALPRNIWRFSDKKIAVWCIDGLLRIWEVGSTGFCERTYWSEFGDIDKVEYCYPNHILARSEDTIMVWDLILEKKESIFEESLGMITGAIRLKDGKVASFSLDDTIKIWSQSEDEPIVLMGHSDRVGGLLEISNQQLLSWSLDDDLILWDLNNFKQIKKFKGHGSSVLGALMLNRGHIISWSMDRDLRIWELETGRCIASLKGHTNTVKQTISIGSDYVASLDDDGLIRIWAIGVESKNFTEAIGAGELKYAKVLGSLVEFGRNKLWDSKAGVYIKEGHSLSRQETLILSESINVSLDTQAQALKVWSSDSGEILHSFRSPFIPPFDYIENIVIPLDNSRILFRDLSKQDLEIVNYVTGKCESRILGIGFDIDYLFLASSNRVISWSSEFEEPPVLWDIKNMKCLGIMSGAEKMKNYHFKKFPSGNIYSVSSDGIAQIWDLQTQDCRFTLQAGEDGITDLLEFEDGRLLSWSFRDSKEIRIWDGKTGVLLLLLEALTNSISSIYILNEKTILATSSDNVLRMLELPNYGKWRELFGHSSGYSICDIRVLPDGNFISLARSPWHTSKEIKELILWDDEGNYLKKWPSSNWLNTARADDFWKKYTEMAGVLNLGDWFVQSFDRYILSKDFLSDKQSCWHAQGSIKLHNISPSELITITVGNEIYFLREFNDIN
jgi:WD40 repeat protein